jgi:hypothetical protein
MTRKCEAAIAVVEPSPSKKAGRGKKRKKALSHLGGKTSERGTLLAKPPKPSKRFSMGHFWQNPPSRVKGLACRKAGLSIGEKALSVKVLPRPLTSTKTGGRKMPAASPIVDDSGYVLTLVTDLLMLSVSEGEVSLLEHRRKCARKSSLPMVGLKSSGAVAIRCSIL